MKKIDLIIVVGFLGSGKTTLLKRLITHYQSKKLGIIMNDFGEKNIDLEQIKTLHHEIKDISNGSLFCSCKSDKFIDEIINYSNQDLDLILVEGSGMSNPNTLIKLLDLVKKKTSDRINYKGTIGVVDVSTVHKVISTNMVKNQIVFSDILLINKTDLVEQNAIKKTMELVREYNTVAELVPTTEADINMELVDSMQYQHIHDTPHNGLDLNTQKVTVQITNEKLIELKEVFENLSPICDRIKGIITSPNPMYVEYVDGLLKTSLIEKSTSSYITFITVKQVNLKEQVIKEFQKVFLDQPNIV